MSFLHDTRRVVGAVVALTTVAAVLGLAPAAGAAEFDVDCDVDELIAAIEATEDDDPDVADVINLEEDCTYVLRDAYDDGEPDIGPNGLPAITETLTINGNGATIRRSSTADTPDFRIFEITEDGDLTLNDLTVKGGRAAMSTGFDVSPEAGGIFNRHGVFTGNDIRVTRNTVDVLFVGQGDMSVDGLGGGIVNFGEMALTASRVDHNGVSAGCTVSDPDICGVLAASGGIFNAGSATLTGTRVDHNRAKAFGPFSGVGVGGGIASGFGVDVGDEENRLVSIFFPSGAMVVERSRIHSNAAAGFGETLAFAGGGGISSFGDVTVTNTRLSYNSVVAGGGATETVAIGGGYHQSGSTVVMDSSRLHRNRAEADGPAGAAALGGGFGQAFLEEEFSPTAILTDTAITRNLAESEEGIARGGGIYAEGEVDLVHARVVGNAADGSFKQGGGIYVAEPGKVVVVNSDVEDNAPDNCFGPGTFTGDPC